MKIPSGRVLRSSCKNLVMIDELLNENSELKKKSDFIPCSIY